MTGQWYARPPEPDVNRSSTRCSRDVVERNLFVSAAIGDERGLTEAHDCGLISAPKTPACGLAFWPSPSFLGVCPLGQTPSAPKRAKNPTLPTAASISSCKLPE